MGLYQVFGTSEMGIWPLIAPVGEHDYRDWAYVQVHPAVAVQFQHRHNNLHELVCFAVKTTKYSHQFFLCFLR